MIFILAIALAVVFGAVAHQSAERNQLGAIARVAAAVAGAIVGFVLTYILARYLGV